MSKKEIFNHIFNTSIASDVDELYIYDVYSNGAVARMLYRFFSGDAEVTIKGFLVSAKNEDFFEDIPILEYELVKTFDVPILIGSYDCECIAKVKSLLLSDHPDLDIIVMKFDPENYNLEQQKWIQFFEQFDIYNRLMDEESKMIYRYKAAFDIFGRDWRYVRELIRKTNGQDCYESADYVGLLEFIKKSVEEDKIRFVLAGEYSELIVERITELGYPIDAYYGEDRGTTIPIIDEADLFGEFSQHYILVKDYENRLNFLGRLSKCQIPKERIILACNCGCGMEYGHPMYFDKIFTPSSDGIFVDGGCFAGETINDFINWNKNYRKVYSFEPDLEQFKKCKNRYIDDQKIKILNYAVWDKKETLHFFSNGAGSRIVSDSLMNVEGVSVDEIVMDDKVTFLKFDIEGSEMKGLAGAEKTIIKNKPDLAICVYHKCEDLFTIPNFVIKLCSDYKIYLRHYQLSKYETVLLATCK